MGYPKLLANLAHVPLGAALVLHDAGAANDSQICNLREIGQNFVLHSISEISVLSFIAPVFEWKHGDTFLRNRRPVSRGRPRTGSACRFDSRPLQQKRNTNTNSADDHNRCGNKGPTACRWS